MKRLIALLAIVGLLSSTTLASAHYHHHIFIPHPKPVAPPPKSTAKQPSGGGSSSNTGFWIGGFAACILVGQMVDTFQRKGHRTREDEQAVIANCFLPFLGGYLVSQYWRNKKPEWLHYRNVPVRSE